MHEMQEMAVGTGCAITDALRLKSWLDRINRDRAIFLERFAALESEMSPLERREVALRHRAAKGVATRKARA